MSDSFSFEVNDVFCIVGRGLVFRGDVQFGKLIPNQTVAFTLGDIDYSANVAFIELDRKIVQETVIGKEMGLLLTDFNIVEINDYYINAPTDEGMADDYPRLKDVLNIEYPFSLESSASI